MATLREVTEDTFETEVIHAHLPILVDFWAAWCAPCRAMEPILEQLARDYESRLEIVKVNVQSDPDVAAEHGVTSIPTILLFVDGEAKEHLVGQMPRTKITERIEPYLEG
ncbi:MAG: thioredoxin [Chloroflexi bacterium RBG_13_56_8]|nr:MAG: thioredoxin [Chloroflexi bacterium RBG_13_56_8]